MDTFPQPQQIDHPAASAAVVDMPGALELQLRITDAEMIRALIDHAAGDERHEFALSALRIGLLAIHHAGGAIDTAAIQREAERMFHDIDAMVTTNARTLTTRLAGSLEEYFDPNSGKLCDRLNRLVKKDGELSAVLSQHLDGDTSKLAQTLVRHVGAQSPLLQMLSPTQKDGLLAKIDESVRKSLEEQRAHILKQFSLDEEGSALKRLVEEITDGNGKLRDGLVKDVESLKSEFSADNKDSAINRLTGMLQKTHEQVADCLTLDKEDSPLALLARELREQIGKLTEESSKFQAEIRQTLEVDKARKAEAAGGTQHGKEFELLVGDVLSGLCAAAGETTEFCRNTIGNIQRCRVGDHIITLGPDSAAPGARIVVECKEDASYTEAKALAELKTACNNRDAQVGIFIFSSVCAPENCVRLRRIGNAILCIWNKENADSDLIIDAAVSIARALVVRQRAESARASADFSAIDSAINKIEKNVAKTEKLETWAKNILRDSSNILETLEPIRAELEAQIQRLRDTVADLKEERTAQP